MAITLKYATKADLVVAFRAAYKNAMKEDVCRLAYRLNNWITAGDVTDAQLKSAFGLTTAQLTSFKTRVAAKAQIWSDLIAQVGE